MTIKSEKLIFLDIDGVLNSLDNMRAMNLLEKNVSKNIKSRDEFGHLFDERCVRWLQYIISKTGADIVLSSAWSKLGLEKIQEMWKNRELPGSIIDVCSYDAPWDWMDKNNYTSKFAIINDDFTESLVVVSPNPDVGIQIKDVHRVLTILNS